MHYLTAGVSATRAMHCQTSWGRRAMEDLQRAGRPARGTESAAQESVDAEKANLLQCTATLPGGSGQWNSCHALPGCLRAVGRAIPAMHCHTTWGPGQWNSCNALTGCLGAVDSGTPSTHCLTAWGRWAVEFLQYTSSLPRVGGQWNSFHALPHYSGALGGGTRALQCLNCLGAVGNGTPATHWLIAWGRWAVQILQCTATLLEVSGRCNSCDALPRCLGALDCATCAIHCLTA